MLGEVFSRKDGDLSRRVMADVFPLALYLILDRLPRLQLCEYRCRCSELDHGCSVCRLRERLYHNQRSIGATTCLLAAFYLLSVICCRSRRAAICLGRIDLFSSIQAPPPPKTLGFNSAIGLRKFATNSLRAISLCKTTVIAPPMVVGWAVISPNKNDLKELSRLGCGC